MRIRNVNRFPPAELEITVRAKQFEWLVTYPGPDNQLGTADDFERRNRLDLPVGRVVYVHLEAEDVIHSFFLPEFRVKQDAVPGCASRCGSRRSRRVSTYSAAPSCAGWVIIA
jgi:cytochrome c oxidase subunit 2